MATLNFFRDEPVIAWLVLLGLLLLIVSVASVLRNSMPGRSKVKVVKQPAQIVKPTRFGNQTDLIVLFLGFLGLMLLLAFIGWIRSTFFG